MGMCAHILTQTLPWQAFRAKVAAIWAHELAACDTIDDGRVITGCFQSPFFAANWSLTTLPFFPCGAQAVECEAHLSAILDAPPGPAAAAVCATTAMLALSVLRFRRGHADEARDLCRRVKPADTDAPETRALRAVWHQVFFFPKFCSTPRFAVQTVAGIVGA